MSDESTIGQMMATAMTDDPANYWGQPISAEWQVALQRYLDRWQAEMNHSERKGAFDRGGLNDEERQRVRLSGADVSWLAEQSGLNQAGEAPNLRLEGADLSRAHLEWANLRGAHLEGADLYRAHLVGADLARAQLEGANLIGAQLVGARLYRAHLVGADLRLTWLDSKTLLNDAVLNSKTLLGDMQWGE
jgi:hypothetical protein